MDSLLSWRRIESYSNGSWLFCFGIGGKENTSLLNIVNIRSNSINNSNINNSNIDDNNNMSNSDNTKKNIDYRVMQTFMITPRNKNDNSNHSCDSEGSSIETKRWRGKMYFISGSQTGVWKSLTVHKRKCWGTCGL